MSAPRRRTPAILGIAGPSGSGKTTLIERLLPLLRAEGLRVSTIKHVHHRLELDRPGKDSYRHRAAGAEEVMVALPDGWALFHAGGGRPDLRTLAGVMAPVDLVLVEGFRALPMDKIEVFSSAVASELNQPRHPSVVAVAADAPPAGLTVPTFDRDDIVGVAGFIVGRLSPPPTDPRRA